MRYFLLLCACSLPFFFFLSTYFALSLYTRSSTITVPHVIGLPLFEAATLISEANLQLRILSIEKDPLALPSTVLKQTPSPQQKARPQQTVYITLSERPQPPITPQLIHQSISYCEQTLKPLEIQPQYFSISSKYPLNTCIGQFPEAGTPCKDGKILIYLSAGSEHIAIMPRLIGLTPATVSDFLTAYNIKTQITQPVAAIPEAVLKQTVVCDQMPYPGSFINLPQLATVHISVGSRNNLQHLAEMLF